MWWRQVSSAAGWVIAVTLAGCGSGDSTVAKTPLPSKSATEPPTTESAPSAPSAQPAPTNQAATPSVPPPPAADPCTVNLAAPEITDAVAQLPRDPRSRQGWNPEPLAGNYSRCAPLSAVIVRANTNAENPNTRAVLFHLGKYIPTGVPDTYGFNGIDAAQSTADTLALTYSGGMGLQSVVKFRWNGNAVELIGNM